MSYDKWCRQCCSKYCTSKEKIIMGSELCACDCDQYCEDDPDYLIEDETRECEKHPENPECGWVFDEDYI